MSVHPSFKSGKNKQQNSVLKRLARLLQLQKDDKWDEEKDSIFGLPKVKVTKLKFKKDKKTGDEEEEAAAGAAPVEGAAAPAEGAKKEDATPSAEGKGKK